MGNLEELWKKFWKINEASEKRGRNLVDFDEIGSEKRGIEEAWEDVNGGFRERKGEEERESWVEE